MNFSRICAKSVQNFYAKMSLSDFNVVFLVFTFILSIRVRAGNSNVIATKDGLLSAAGITIISTKFFLLLYSITFRYYLSHTYSFRFLLFLWIIFIDGMVFGKSCSES